MHLGEKKVLFTGMHRSGTSAISNLCCYAAGRYLLDDPDWAVTIPTDAIENIEKKRLLSEFHGWKIPRLAPFADKLLDSNANVVIVWVLRSPVDVYYSILERAKIYPETTMLRFPEIGLVGDNWLSVFSAAFEIYMSSLNDIIQRNPDRIGVVLYEDFYKSKEIAIQKLCSEFLDWRYQKSILEIQHFQFGPIRHKSDKIRGPGSYDFDHGVTQDKSMLKLLAIYEESISGISKSTSWMFDR